MAEISVVILAHEHGPYQNRHALYVAAAAVVLARAVASAVALVLDHRHRH